MPWPGQTQGGEEPEGEAGAVRHKAALKAAESKVHRAKLRLARMVVDNGTTLEEEQSRIEDVKELDGRIRDLS